MLAQLIYNQWKGFNFDNVHLVNYSVLLSYPNTSQPNVLKLMQGSEVIYKAKIGLEPPHTPGENNSNVAPPFNAYSGSGTATVSSMSAPQNSINRLSYAYSTGSSCVCELCSY